MTQDTEGLHPIANTDRTDRVANVVFVHGLGGMSDWWQLEAKERFYEVVKPYRIACLISGHSHGTSFAPWHDLLTIHDGSTARGESDTGDFLVVRVTENELIVAQRKLDGTWGITKRQPLTTNTTPPPKLRPNQNPPQSRDRKSASRRQARVSHPLERVNRTVGACELTPGACKITLGTCKSGPGACQAGEKCGLLGKSRHFPGDVRVKPMNNAFGRASRRLLAKP